MSDSRHLEEAEKIAACIIAAGYSLMYGDPVAINDMARELYALVTASHWEKGESE